MYKRKILTICFFFFLYISKGQQLYFKSLTVNDGLTQHDVSCVLRDSYGFMWIGTYDGLNRYDGYNILNFSKKSNNIASLSTNRIVCLFEDSKKRIWIGTDGGGLNYYSLITEKFVRVETPKGFDRIAHIVENSKGDIFFATSGGVLKTTKSSLANEVAVDILQLPITGLRTTRIAIDNANNIFFSTSNGIWNYSNNSCTQLKGTENSFCLELIIDKKNQLWAIVNGKLKLLKFGQPYNNITDIEVNSNAKFTTLCQSLNGVIWVGTENMGLFAINENDYSTIQHIKYNPLYQRGLLSNSIVSLYSDNANNLWIGNRQGVCYTNLAQNEFKNISFEGLKNVNLKPHINSLLLDDNFLYYGIQGRGLFRHSFTNNTSEELIEQENIFPLCITKFDSTIYVGTNKGVFEKKSNASQFNPINIQPKHNTPSFGQVLSICGDGNGGKYFGTFTGLLFQKGDVTDWLHYLYPQTEILRGKRVFSLLYDKEGSCIWIGTIGNGIYKLNLHKGGNFISLEQYNQAMKTDYNIADNNIWCFYTDNLGTLWVGTDAGLLQKPKNSNKFEQLKIEDIVDKKIMGIVKDEIGNLWLTNSHGLIRFNIAKKIVRRYSYNDGLQSSTFTEAVSKSNDGTLYFGSIHGIDFFNPKQLGINLHQSGISISDFKIHNVRIEPTVSYFGKTVLNYSINQTNELTLNYKQNNFLFEFTATNYTNTEENRFRYKLDGYDARWVQETGKHRFASYSNLKPGTYTFWVDAANSDGIWSNKPKKMNITILPAPWFSMWAYLAYCLIGLGIIALFVFLQNNRQKLRHEIAIKKIQYENDKEINDLRLMFFTDVAHEFKTPLSLIIGPLKDLTNERLTDDHRNFCFKIISRNTKRMMFLVTQLLDFNKVNANKNILKISESNMSEFISQISKAFLWQAQNEKINFNIIATDEFECFFDRDLIEKVVYNLLSNAFKNTPNSGIVEIEVKPIWNSDNQIANIIVRDSGNGIPNEQKGKIFERYFHGNQKAASGIGLHLSYNLINAHKGTINVTNSIYGGTEFILSIPVSKNNYLDFELLNAPIDVMHDEELIVTSDIAKHEIKEDPEYILIVEDDHDLRAYLKNCLQANYFVMEAHDGSEGWQKAKEKLPDIIITDVMMPKMNGIEMCKMLKANIETSHIPILILTAKSAKEQEQEGLNAGAFDYITKPFDTQSLLKKIANIIESRKSLKKTLFGANANIDVNKHYTSFDQKLLVNAIKVIEDNMSDEEFTVEDFAKAIGFSRMQLHRKLKSLVGSSATEFINTIKINHATKMFDNGCDRVNEAMYAVGINSYSYFNKLFKKVNGKTASEYLKDKLV